MGQLEKYGLYVLCLVIFLILGVAIWGEPVAVHGRGASAVGQQSAGTPNQSLEVSTASSMGDLQALMRPAPRPQSETRVAVSPASTPVDSAPRPALQPAANAPAPVEVEARTEAAAAPSASSPAPQGNRTYVIKSGDTLSEIAQEQLGSMRFAALLVKLNPGIRADRLQLGQKLRLPTVTEVASVSGPVKGIQAGSLTYRIKRGDTLEGLAKSRLGDSRRVREIKKLNPTVDPTRLRVGQIVYLPTQ